MADYDSSLPIRSEADGADERVQVKIVDATSPDSQQAIVDTDSNLHVEVHGNNPAAGDETLRLSELGAPNPDGDYDVTNNTKPASVGMIAHDRNAAVDDTHQNKRVTAVAGANDTVCLDVAIRDESGVAFSGTNPMPVTFEQSEGTEVHNFDQAVNTAASGSTDHDYSVANGVTLQLKEILASASAKARFELKIGDGAISEVFATKAVVFNSTANPNAPIVLTDPLIVVGTVNTTTVRVTKTNLDNQPQDVYTTIIGVES